VLWFHGGGGGGGGGWGGDCMYGSGLFCLHSPHSLEGGGGLSVYLTYRFLFSLHFLSKHMSPSE
jgi:hypothetical protein